VSLSDLDQQKYDLELKKYDLERWKLGVSALTPVMIALMTAILTWTLNQQQSRLRQSEQILSEKQKAYAEIGRGLNVIYAFIADVGDFYEYTPLQITSKKGDVDRVYHMYCPFWSAATKASYEEFMRASFEMGGPLEGRKARILTTVNEKHSAWAIHGKEWKREWDDRVTGVKDLFLSERYYKLVSLFMNDITTSKLTGCTRFHPETIPR
jgi:hypothetical protein